MAKRLPGPSPRLAGYSYVRPLGTGGFADVFMYEQEMPRRVVAVKVLLSAGVDAEVVRMFNAEADAMAKLSAQPSILTVYEASIAPDGRPYLVMEYCPRSLEGYRTLHLSVAETLRIGVKISCALETAHRSRMLHRDIKPSNILFTAYNTPVLSDFGIATAIGPQRREGRTAMSVPWSAPEIVSEESTGSVATEGWALGRRCTPCWRAGVRSRPVATSRARGWWPASAALAIRRSIASTSPRSCRICCTGR